MTLSSSNKPTKLNLVITADTKSQRLDSYLGKYNQLNLTRSRIQKLLADGLILVNGEPASKKYKIKAGDKIVITITPLPPTEVKGENIPLDIIYEDDYLAVINKPSGMVTHPGAGNRTGTLVNALIYHFEKLSRISSVERPGIVHRLDKGTSGLLLVAKEDEVFIKLQKAIQAREIKRTYHTLICGHVKEEKGIIDLPIGRSLKDRKKMSVTKIASRQALTGYRLLKRFRSYDLLEVNLNTGRTHQIRVHFSHLGHPVFGDPQYGGREKWHRGIFAPERPLAKKLLTSIDRQALHAKRLEFVHPFSMKKISLDSNLPDDFQNVLDLLENEGY